MRTHQETHLGGRAAWLRAAVLGADDGIVSTAALMAGIAAASGSRAAILTAGVAGLVAGAMSMAAGEYVSVSSQRDAERADVEKERRELNENPPASWPNSPSSTNIEAWTGRWPSRSPPPSPVTTR